VRGSVNHTERNKLTLEIWWYDFIVRDSTQDVEVAQRASGLRLRNMSTSGTFHYHTSL
jgi:hypothetical protein